jgi:hypothetical protein
MSLGDFAVVDDVIAVKHQRFRVLAASRCIGSRRLSKLGLVNNHCTTAGNTRDLDMSQV